MKMISLSTKHSLVSTLRQSTISCLQKESIAAIFINFKNFSIETVINFKKYLLKYEGRRRIQ